MKDDASPRLVWTDDGAPRSGRFGDVYFSSDDGLAESRAVFLEGCGLPEAWAGRRRFTIGELGFGTGLNIAALLDLWRRHRPPGGRLHVFTTEAYPLSRDEAGRALSAWPDIAEAASALLERWPAPTPGFHRLDLSDFSATIDLAIGDAAWALDQWTGAADAWFLDGFSPALNPGMWSDAVLDSVAARSAPGARLATFTVAGAVRRGLEARGFDVAKRPGHGRKRERLEARLSGDPSPITRPQVAIIGAGVAGAAAARALMAVGLAVSVIETDRPGAGASGFAAALVTPRLDVGDGGIAALHAQALERAGQLYTHVPGAILSRGVLQLEQAPRDAARYDKVAAQPLWPAGAMRRLEAAEVSGRMKEPVDVGALEMGDALVVDPAAVLSDWLEGAALVKGRAGALKRHDGRWRVLDQGGAVLVEADAVVIAAGWGVAELMGAHPLAPVRGQAEWADVPVRQGVAWGGYVAGSNAGVLFGATHERGDTATDIRPADRERNWATLTARVPGLAARISGPVTSRAAIRATTPDRLPLAGAAPGAPDLYLLTGLGSRAFCLAPLLGEHVAALISGAPSPLAKSLAVRLHPDRFEDAAPPVQPAKAVIR
jgi:tRNA 5-methylaminomethyl-2-thiouridine biosynthesis bifunctional protein